MTWNNRTFAFSAAAAGVLTALLIAQPAAAAQRSPAKPFFALVGIWNGKGQLTEAGGKPVALRLHLICTKAAGNWAVTCDMTARGHGMFMREADLMGVDPITGQGHWYAITNQGDVHDHLTQWTDRRHMTAQYTWTQDGKKMEEHITVTLPRRHAMQFRSTVTADGNEVNAFTGKLKR